jgi:hypothetical protein
MSFFAQLFLASLVLFACTGVHVSALVWITPRLKAVAQFFDEKHPRLKIAGLLVITLSAIIVGHTLQIWIWAASYLLLGAIQSMDASLYFSIVTYTTLGYGDIVLSEGTRIYGSIESVNGLLTFGISTAFLLGVISRVLGDVLDS